MVDARSLLRDARDMVAKAREAHMSGSTLDADTVVEMSEFLEKSERFV